MRPAIGLAEPHPGRSRPIGAAFLVEELVYLALVGYDVGCGIGLWRTSLGGGCSVARPGHKC